MGEAGVLLRQGTHLLGEVSEPTMQNETERGLCGVACFLFSHWNCTEKYIPPLRWLIY